MASTGDWGEAPPNVDLAQNQAGSLIASVAIMTIIGMSAVVMRVIARLKCGAGIAEDDYFIFIALLFAVGTAACCLACVYYGGGKHLWSTTTEEFIKVFQITYAFVLIFATAVTMTKVSILLYYRRLFGATWSHNVCMFLVVGYEIAVVMAWLSGVRPISYYWTQYTDPSKPGHSIDYAKFFLYNGICASAIDILILLVPFPTTGIMRLIACDLLTSSTDVTWAMGEVFIWSCCEPFMGILCACLPTFAPLFRLWLDRTSTNRSKRSGNAMSSGRALEDACYKASATATSRISTSKSGRQWTRLQEYENSQQMRGGDEEFELTTVSHQTNKYSNVDLGMEGGIVVRQDVNVVVSPKK
ncbi:hypothetical protein VMCG_10148 [Cytospora schulzeri]|uniref:Rhodopsin domain-containing protein n=1 Tax=Cytospora schulzeri TaxID=448051 RepID=A0A423VDC4_9PEZI|nr:hypothetical protein VMCG_10148 [Valsa malicola]